MQSIADLVKNKYPQLSELSLREAIEQCGKLVDIPAGTILVDYGDYVRDMPLVLEGTLKVMREDELGRTLFLYALNAGDICTMSFTCCMVQKKSSIQAIAETDARIVAIPLRYVDSWMGTHPTWRNLMMQSFEARMNELVKTIDSIAFKHMDERLSDYLKQKATPTGEVITTHQQLANDLNASREAISRLLKQMEQDGIVELGRNRIIWKG